MTPSDVVELDPPVRFSRSLLWRLQRASYQAQGPLAWRPGAVPLQVTSNPFIARQYAAVIAGLVRDLRAAGRLTRPLRIVELGAGSGRFAHYLLHALAEAFARDGEAPYRLIMTDVAASNLEAWAAHPKLRRFVDEGVLAFGLFDAGAPGPIAAGDELLAADERGEPVVAIANYFFDTIPCDAWRIEGGRVRELRVAIDGPGGREQALLDPAAALEVATWRVVEGERAPDGDGELDALAEAYAGEADGRTVLAPAAGFATLDTLARVGGGRLLVLTSDKGYRELALRDGAAADDLTLVRHGGCLSVSVNFHALAWFVERRGGFALPEQQRHDGFYSGVLGLGLDPRELPRTLDAVDELERFGPGDYQRLIDHTVAGDAVTSVEHVLTLVRLGGFDPRQVARFAGALATALRARRDWLARDVAHVLERARELHFPLPGQPDGFLAALGTLFFHLRRPARAVVCLEQALDGSAGDARTHVQLAMCWLDLGRTEEAEAAVGRALALAPGMPEAVRLQAWMATGEPPP